MIDRRLFVSGLGGALVAAGCSPTIGLAQASGKQLRVTHAVTSLAYIQSYIAQQKGYFSQAGLTAQLIDTGGGGPDVQLVLGGRAEMTVNDGAQVLPALQQGQKLVCVLSLLNRSIVNATISQASATKLGVTQDMPLSNKLARMKGMKIGVTRPGALTWQQARFNLVNAGLDPDKDAPIVAVGGPPALAAALVNGAVDVIYISMPIGEKLIQEGKALSFIDNVAGEDSKLAHFLMEGLWTTPDYLAANRKVVEAAVAAYRKASNFIRLSPPEEVVSELMPSLGSLGQTVLLDSVRRMKPAISETGKLTAAEFDTTQALLKMNGFLSKPFSIDEVSDGSFT
jgi:NitT/TauT family transport system substrate-binding protein